MGAKRNVCFLATSSLLPPAQSRPLEAKSGHGTRVNDVLMEHGWRRFALSSSPSATTSVSAGVGIRPSKPAYETLFDVFDGRRSLGLSCGPNPTSLPRPETAYSPPRSKTVRLCQPQPECGFRQLHVAGLKVVEEPSLGQRPVTCVCPALRHPHSCEPSIIRRPNALVAGTSLRPSVAAALADPRWTLSGRPGTVSRR